MPESTHHSPMAIVNPQADAVPAEAKPSRRGFMRWALRALQAIIGAVLGVPAVCYLSQSGPRASGRREFRRVARLSEIVERGMLSPNTGKRVYEVPVWDTLRDAWTIFPNEILGRVWLVFDPQVPLDPKRPESALTAFTSACPHLGCSVRYALDADQFVCPCHAGVFDLSGDVVDGPPPRPMDRLAVRLVRDQASPPNRPDYFVEVRFQEFLPEQPTPIPKT
ncbi:Cytochrome b6-f complex iron-sulfur subunit [bacterium HR36]|nr:Cytochrome b6-f complex iron-sulfur subunit [bacterium HR36]